MENNMNCSCTCPCNNMNVGPEIDIKPACVRPCWDPCTCMDMVQNNTERIENLERDANRAVNNINSKVTRDEQVIRDNFDSLSRAIGDLAEVIDNKVAVERDRATVAEQTIQLNLDQYIESNDAALRDERSARIQGDNQLAQSISDEAERAGNAENAITSSLNSTISDLQDEHDRAVAKENSLEDAINEEITDRRATIANEAEERRAADTLLQQNINNEVTNRISGDDAIRQLVLDIDDSLINYYTKSDVYTKGEVQQIISNIRQFQYKLAASLPQASEDTIGFIYLIPAQDPATSNIKDEYITISSEQNNEVVYSWERIGSTSVSLDGYSTTEQMNAAIQAALSGYATTSQAVGGVSINGNVLTFTSISGATIATITIPSLWNDNGTTLTPSSNRSVTAAGFYDSTIN